MLLNLSKTFHFDRDQKNYAVNYIFTKELIKDAPATDICLALEMSVNDEKKRFHKINKSSSTLYQSNEAIEKMIKEDTLSFFNL